jgi:alkanesulfonate monooxygenase SsuD/methylene tetrahydromethanopterin reductase-like flavin-dependent oxidoreductase (luciferase family)
MGGTADVALRRIGRIADGWISSSRTDLATIGQSVDVVRSEAAEWDRDPSGLRFVTRGVVRLGTTSSGDRVPLQGSADQIRDDLAALAASGITEVFLDLNWDPDTVSADIDADAALEHAEQVMTALAP